MEGGMDGLSRIGLECASGSIGEQTIDAHLGTNPGGTLEAARLLVDPSLPEGRAAKSCIIAMAVMCPLMDGLSAEQEC